MTNKLLNRTRLLLERDERITWEDCAALFEERNLLMLASIARLRRERRYGRRAHVLAAARVDYNGEDPELFLSEAETMLEGTDTQLVVACSARDAGDSIEAWEHRMHIWSRSPRRVFTRVGASFVAALSAASGRRFDEVLSRIRSAGRLLLDGEGAELFDATVRSRLAPEAIDPGLWFDVHRAAHSIGLKSTCSMTYMIEDQPHAYARHLERLRTLQDETEGFVAFTPLPMYDRSSGASHLSTPTAAQSLRAVAIARAFLDNVPHIAAPAVLVGTEIAVVALDHGADVVDAVARPQDVAFSNSTGGSAETGLPIVDASEVRHPDPLEAIRAAVGETRLEAVLLDANYERLTRGQDD